MSYLSSYIRLYVDHYVKFDNKRETKRYNVDMCSRISVFNEYNYPIKKDIKFYVKDLSLGGLYGIIPKKNIEDIDDRYPLSFQLNTDSVSAVNFDAEIIRISDRELSYEVAVKFKYMTD